MGSLVSVAAAIFITVILFIGGHFLLNGKRPEKIPTFVQQVVLRVGTIHALVVALVFSSLAGDLHQLKYQADQEAISAANIYFALQEFENEEAVRIKSLIPTYMATVITQEWKELSYKPHNMPAWEIIKELRGTTLAWQTTTPSETMLKTYIFNKLNEISEYRNKRLIEWRVGLPTIFWIIAFGGYLLTILPFLSVRLSKLRLLLICAYATIIGITFYAIAALDNPFASQMLQPISFEIMYGEIS